MFLNQLDEEKKRLFLEICINGAMANNDFANEQKEMIKLYCDEMRIENYSLEAKYNMDEIMSRLKKCCTETEKRIIAFELTGLILSDHKYDKFERAFMEEFNKENNISSEEHNQMISLINKLTELYTDINRLIFNV